MSLYDKLAAEIAKHKDGVYRYRTGAGVPGASIHVFFDDTVPTTARKIVGEVRGNRILTAWPDGTILLDSCGWHTVTTSMAWNGALRFGGYHVESRQKRYRLYGHGHMDDFEVVKSGLYLEREVLTWKEGA